MAVNDFGDDVGQISVRLDAVEFAGFDQRCDDSPMLTSAVGASGERILSIERDRPNAALDHVGIDLDAAGRKRLRLPLVAELSHLRTDDLPHDLPRNTKLAAYRLDRLTVNEIRATDLRNRLHDQHSNLGSHENGSRSGPSVPGFRFGCRLLPKWGPYSMPKHTRPDQSVAG